MRLAILITNTDFSNFAKRHPHDGEKFAAMIQSRRSNWRCDWFWACKGALPSDPDAFDGFIVTGSPASVTEDAPWMLALTAFLRDRLSDNTPIFGACFGHQLIARALGSAIVRNPDGWGHGRLDVRQVGDAPWLGAVPETFSLYGSHIEQVDVAPPGADVVLRGPGCPVAGFARGCTLFTVQHHPEMSPEFIAALVEEYADYVGDEVTRAARASLSQPADNVAFAEAVCRFFEGAVAAR